MTLNHTGVCGGLPVKFPSYLQDTQHCGHSSAVWQLSYITDEHGETQYIQKKKKRKKTLNDDALRRLNCCITCCEDKTQAAAPPGFLNKRHFRQISVAGGLWRRATVSRGEAPGTPGTLATG